MTTTVSWAESIPAPTARRSERGAWHLEQPQEAPVEHNGTITTTLHMGTRNSGASDILARICAYSSPEDLDEQLHGAAEARSKVFVLRHGVSMFDVPGAEIRQGTAFLCARGLGLLGVGKRTQGTRLDVVLDMIVGTNKNHVDTLNERWYLGTGIPPTTVLSKEALKSASSKNPLAIIWTHPGFGEGHVPGCVWYVNEAHEDIVEGYLWCPPSALVSEHGSIKISDILDGALCSVTPQVSFAGCFDLPDTRREAYHALFGA